MSVGFAKAATVEQAAAIRARRGRALMGMCRRLCGGGLWCNGLTPFTAAGFRTRGPVRPGRRGGADCAPAPGPAAGHIT